MTDEAVQETGEVSTETEVESSTTENESTQSNGYEKRISTLVARDHHKSKELNQLKAELETLKAAKAESQQSVEIPELPEDDLRFDNPEEYKQKVNAYHNAIAEQAVQNANKNVLAQQKAEEEKSLANERQTQQQEIVNKYIDSGIKSGISEVKMQANEVILAENGITPELATFIYSDENGAQIVDYLADNPDKIQELKSAPHGMAFVKIANEIKPQALSGTPTQTNAPDPISPTRGSGVPPSEDRPMIKGASFE